MKGHRNRWILHGFVHGFLCRATKISRSGCFCDILQTQMERIPSPIVSNIKHPPETMVKCRGWTHIFGTMEWGCLIWTGDGTSYELFVLLEDVSFSDRLRCRETTRLNERTRMRLVSRVSFREILDGWHQVLLSIRESPNKNPWDGPTIDAFWRLLGPTALWPSYLVYAVVGNSEPIWCCRFLGTSIGNHDFYMFLLWTIPSP